MSVLMDSSVLLSLSPSNATELYSTREGGFRPAVKAPPKLAKKKVFKNAKPMSVSSFNDLAVPDGRINLEESKISVIPESETVEIGKHLTKDFRTLKNFRENKMFKKELRRVSASLQLHKVYLVSKPRVHKVRKVDRALKPIPIISKKRKPKN